MGLSALWWGAVLPALGQTPVVHVEGPADAAVAWVMEHTGLPASQLEAVPIEALLAAPPTPLGDAALRRCPHDPVQSEGIRAQVGRIEVAWSERDRPVLRDRLDRTVAQLGCLSEVVEGPVAAHVFLLRGGLFAADGEIDAARAELVTARALDPSAAWSDALPPEGRAVFDALPQHPEATLSAAPERQPIGPWLDGRRLDGTAAVSPGLHLLQFTDGAGIASGWLSVGGDARVVFPRGFRPSMLAQMGSEPGNAAMAALLSGALPAIEAAYVIDGGGLWLVTREGDGLVTTEIVARPAPEPVMTPKEQRRRDRAARKAARRGA